MALAGGGVGEAARLSAGKGRMLSPQGSQSRVRQSWDKTQGGHHPFLRFRKRSGSQGPHLSWHQSVLPLHSHTAWLGQGVTGTAAIVELSKL